MRTDIVDCYTVTLNGNRRPLHSELMDVLPSVPRGTDRLAVVVLVVCGVAGRGQVDATKRVSAGDV
jgi:hypothetical protein